MLSADLAKIDNDVSKLRYPVLASPKFDGVRCLVWDGVAFSRNAKPIRNRFVQSWAAKHHNIDGELIVGSPTDGNVLGRAQSGVMSFDGEPDFVFYLFDMVFRLPFKDRLDALNITYAGSSRILNVTHKLLRNAVELEAYEARCLEDGYEGVMLRDPDGPYKHGRSTLKEGYLMKLKRFMDGEAVVTALGEALENTNEATMDELGRTKRSSAKAGKVGKGMVGTIVVQDPKWGELRLSPGTMLHEERARVWQTRDLIGKTVHWRSFGYGVKDKPRFPRFYGVKPAL